MVMDGSRFESWDRETNYHHRFNYLCHFLCKRQDTLIKIPHIFPTGNQYVGFMQDFGHLPVGNKFPVGIAPHIGNYFPTQEITSHIGPFHFLRGDFLHLCSSFITVGKGVDCKEAMLQVWGAMTIMQFPITERGIPSFKKICDRL